MIQEQKELLLKDLCARLPYEVIIHYHWERKGTIVDVVDEDRKLDFSDVESLKYILIEMQDNQFIIEWKPYLRPMSSMTKEELYEVQGILGKGVEIREGFLLSVYSSINSFTYLELQAVFDWLNAHHFDHRGLIPMGLAIEVTEENNPYKKLKI